MKISNSVSYSNFWRENEQMRNFDGFLVHVITCDVEFIFVCNHHQFFLIMCNSLFLIEQTLQRLDLCRVLLLDGTIYVLVTSRGHQQEGIGKQLRNHRFHTLKKTKQKITK